MIVETAVDFKKAIFEQFDGDRCKAMIHAIKELHNNLKIGDPQVWICLGDDVNKDGIGEGGVKVPTNMTSLCNYCIGLSPKIFQSKGTQNQNQEEEGDNLDSLGGDSSNKKKKSKRNTTVAYFQLRISCNKDPFLLVSQVSFEWGKFGTFFCKKELQAMDTGTHFCFYFLYSFSTKSVLCEEFLGLLKKAQENMLEDLVCYDFPLDYLTDQIPEFNFRQNVPKIPKLNTHEQRVQSKYEATKRHFHLEIRSEDKPMFLALVNYLKRSGLMKEYWGAHVHCSEVVDFNSTPGDLKRAEKFYYRSMNYNASLTASDVDSFKNISDKI